MTITQIGILIAIVLYMAIIVGVGIKFSKNTTTGNYYLGGRKLGPFVTAMSAEASDMSSWLLMGLPGVAYLTGLSEATWTAIGLAVGTYVNWLIVAKRLRTYSVVSGNSITIPEFFNNRFRSKGAIRFVSALIIIIFFVPYTASGFSACGKLFSSLFGIDYLTAMIIGAVVIIVYTTLGGFLAASTTDFIQSIVMSVALIVVIIFGAMSVGGFSVVAENVKDLPGYISLTQSYSPDTGASSAYGFITIVSTLAWGLGYFGMPHILLRFMAIENPKKLTLSRRIASIWVVISMSVAIFIGVVGYSMSSNGILSKLTNADSEKIIIEIAKLIADHGFIFAILAGVILSGILASTMSTADSQLLAASSSASEDIITGVFKVKLSDKKRMIIARTCVIVIAIIGVILASDPDSSVFRIVSFAWAGFGATFGPVMLFALFWKRSNKYGIVSGMVAGAVMIFVWKFLVRPLGGAWDIYELLPAFIIASVVIVIVSLITPAPEKEITDEFDKVKATYKN